MEYPKYVSHKEVSAVQISEVELGADGSLTVHLVGAFDNVTFPHQERKNKPNPEPGWYMILYPDGHVSFSPAKSFEEGYTLLLVADAPTGITADDSAEQADNENNANQAEQEADKGTGPDAEEDEVEEPETANAT